MVASDFMKKLLSLLLCFVFLEAQTFAKHEFPSSQGSLIGVYGGVMVPKSTTIPGGFTTGSSGMPNMPGVTTTPTTKTDTNAIGIFAFIMPQNGFGAGATIIFANGSIYNGSIDAMGDPQNMKINAILSSRYTFNLSQLVTGTNGQQSVVTTPITAEANGTMKARVETGMLGVVNLIGKATISVNTGEVDQDLNPIVVEQTEYEVTGTQQSQFTQVQTITPISIPTTSGT